MTRQIMLVVVMICCLVVSSCARPGKDDANDNLEKTTITAFPAAGKGNNPQKPALALVPKKNKVRYLLTNGVEINLNTRKISTGKGEFLFGYPEVRGLVDKETEEKLNNNIIRECEKEIKTYIETTQDEFDGFYCRMTVNCNNLIAFGLSPLFNIPVLPDPQWGFLFRLTDGERVNLGDVFTKGTEYTGLLKEMALRWILYSEGEEEYTKVRSKINISPDHPFVLNEDSIDLIFDFRTENVKISFEDIDDYVQVFDLYSGTERRTHERLEYIARKNNILLKNAGQSFDLDNGKVFVEYQKIAGLKDKSFEAMVNGAVEKGIGEVIKSGAYDKLERTDSYDGAIARIYVNTAFNHYGYITFRIDNDGLFRLYSYNLIGKKTVDMENILVGYLEDKPDIQLKFAEYINRSLGIVSKEPLSYQEIIRNGMVYFEKYEDFLESNKGIMINVRFDQEFAEKRNGYVKTGCPFREIVSITPEEFFGN